MIDEQQQEQASLYAVGAMNADERAAFEASVGTNAELRQLVEDLQRTASLLAMSVPPVTPPSELRSKILARIGAQDVDTQTAPPISLPAGLSILHSADAKGWKQLPIPGAWIKLLSLERERGYAVLMGKLEPGVQYPAHLNVGPEDFYILSGDLHIGDRRLNAGDFHHADAGSQHEVNHSVEGCTLLAVLTTNDPLVAFAMS